MDKDNHSQRVPHGDASLTDTSVADRPAPAAPSGTGFGGRHAADFEDEGRRLQTGEGSMSCVFHDVLIERLLAKQGLCREPCVLAESEVPSRDVHQTRQGGK